MAWWAGLSDRHLNTLAELKSATGQELHGFNLLPGFNHPETGDYTLASNSDLIDNGLRIPGINDGFAGDAPDIGAFEFACSGFTLIVQPPSQKVEPGGTAIYTIDMQPIGTFTETISLSLVNLPIGLTASLDPQILTLPGQAILTVTDTHTASLYPGIWYGFTIAAEGGSLTENANLWLLVGGVEVFLPVVRK